MRAIEVMSALAQPTRLAVFRQLVASMPEGMASGDIASATKTSPTTMSSHLAILQRAGVITSAKVGRSVVYTAVPRTVAALADFLQDSTGTSKSDAKHRD